MKYKPGSIEEAAYKALKNDVVNEAVEEYSIWGLFNINDSVGWNPTMNDKHSYKNLIIADKFKKGTPRNEIEMSLLKQAKVPKGDWVYTRVIEVTKEYIMKSINLREREYEEYRNKIEEGLKLIKGSLKNIK